MSSGNSQKKLLLYYEEKKKMGAGKLVPVVYLKKGKRSSGSCVFMHRNVDTPQQQNLISYPKHKIIFKKIEIRQKFVHFLMIQNIFEKWFDSFVLRQASKVKNRADTSCDVIMVMNKVFLLSVSSMPVLSILFSFPLGKEAEDFGLGAWISWGKTKPLFLFFIPLFLLLFFQIWNVLWIVSCFSLGFDSIRPVVYRPHLGTVFVWVGVYPKENKNAHERKGENITTAPKYESLIQVLAGWLLLLLRFISRSTRKRRNAFL